MQAFPAAAAAKIESPGDPHDYLGEMGCGKRFWFFQFAGQAHGPRRAEIYNNHGKCGKLLAKHTCIVLDDKYNAKILPHYLIGPLGVRN